ncbi:MAG: hypothetical protein PGN30_10120 [Mycolicibacterium neoaurum]|uniref:phage fiber-tail adaptor protein n=1 Tax=Mycolicibacterium neoaurum TaxID=1795 RepID=UPI002FFCBA97
MAVSPGTAMEGGHAAGNFDTALSVGFDHYSDGGLAVVGASFSAGDLRILWYEDDNDIEDLTRTVTYGGKPMISAGVIEWAPGADAWTEVFLLAGVPSGRQRVAGSVWGGVSGARQLRLGGVVLTGMESIGEPILVSGNGTAMTIAAEAAPADRVVSVFGTLSGISGFNGEQRYVNNSGIGLLVGDKVGTGSPMNLTATRQKPGPWGGIALPMYAADTVATCPPISMKTTFGPTLAYCEPKVGALRRQVFVVPRHSKQKTIGTADPKTPEGVTPITIDYADFLSVTMDRIRDFWWRAPGVTIENRWFTDTDATLLVAGGSVGSVTLSYFIRTWGGEVYSHSIKLPIKNL